MKSEDLDTYTKPLLGYQLMSLEKMDYSWFFRFAGNVSVATESAWRLIIGDQIAVTSEDHGQQFGHLEPTDAASKIRSSTAGRIVETASISLSTGDLTIVFSEQAQLQFLQMSSGYEAWRLSAQSTETICLGGGEIMHIP